MSAVETFDLWQGLLGFCKDSRARKGLKEYRVKRLVFKDCKC